LEDSQRILIKWGRIINLRFFLPAHKRKKWGKINPGKKFGIKEELKTPLTPNL